MNVNKIDYRALARCSIKDPVLALLTARRPRWLLRRRQ